MSILVTGGAGYIGSHTVRRLTALGHEVVVLDSMEYGHRNAVIEAELVEGNIADLDLVIELCNRRDITQVVHFAAYKSVGESMDQPSRYWLNNVTGTVKLVEDLAARRHVSARTLQRVFRRYVGVGPKWVLQRHRLHEAIEQLSAP